MKKRYMRYTLCPVCVKSGLRQNKSKGGPFRNIAKFSKNLISGIGYIRISLYPVRAKSGMGCVIVEEDTLALFTASKISPKNIIRYTLQFLKLMKSAFVGF